VTLLRSVSAVSANPKPYRSDLSVDAQKDVVPGPGTFEFHKQLSKPGKKSSMRASMFFPALAPEEGRDTPLHYAAVCLCRVRPMSVFVPNRATFELAAGRPKKKGKKERGLPRPKAVSQF